MAFDWQGDGISASPDIAELLPNYKFTFVRTNATSCFDADYVNGEYPCLKSSMRFERRYRNLLIGVYFPSLLFVLVAWASFFWPADAIPARTVLLITCLLTTISLYTSVQYICLQNPTRQITPPANYTRAIDIWFFACIVAVASALFEYAVILQLKQLQKSQTERIRIAPFNDLILFIKPKPTEEEGESSDTGANPVGRNHSSHDNSARAKSGKDAPMLSKTPSGGSREGSAAGPPPEDQREGYWRMAELLADRWAKILYMVSFVIFNVAYCSGVHWRTAEDKAEFYLTGNTGSHRSMSDVSAEWLSGLEPFLGAQVLDNAEKGQETVHQEPC
ncbi:glycine receptor subunit alpha-3-like [Penaeus chinensis]|uniref:glycine receptor subunit alpha-3-like n=1 Tax=Penaeus chinensis TaxID=139456 RepID=UPI001FB652AC|nr:glycine receptor subunit alpha-3-like [Penaeus chinensis]